MLSHIHSFLSCKQIMLEILETLPLTPPPAGSGAAAAAAAADIKGLRVWLCATLQPVIADRPRAIQAFMACRGIPLLCRQLVAGPADIAVHACGVIASALRHSSTSGGSGRGAVPGSEAVDVSLVCCCRGRDRGRVRSVRGFAVIELSWMTSMVRVVLLRSSFRLRMPFLLAANLL